jgi:predicted nucleic acid-binding protein
MVIVDSSVWISFFRNDRPTEIPKLLESDSILTNEVILTEICPKLLQNNETEVLKLLFGLERKKLYTDWPIIRSYQDLNLRNGLNKIGIPDLLILQQIIDQNLVLYSFDKHFKLMQEIFDFDLIT